MPNGDIIESTAQTTLDIPNIPSNATLVHMFPGLHSHSLLSIGQLFNEGCIATFDNNAVTISLNDKVILEGSRDIPTGLWMIPVPIASHPKKAITIHGLANQVNAPTKVAELVAFAHAALFSPAITTLQRAIDQHFLHDFPGLTSRSIRRFPPSSISTVKGHLGQSRKNQRSTKRKNKQMQHELQLLSAVDDDTAQDLNPTPLEAGLTHCCFASTFAIDETGQVFSDQTGRFPTPSSSGMKEVFVLHDNDTNSIHAVPMRDKTATEILNAYQSIHKTLTRAGRKPKLHRLDNECSTILKDFMADNDITLQLVPPGQHRVNAAERAIRTFKNHFIAGLATCDPKFPISLWDRLIPQACITLNLLRASRINPKLSAHASVFGQFSYNHTPLAPPGTHVLVHEKPDKRKTWEVHAIDAWYVGPALDHYRSYRVHAWNTNAERITDTLTWLPKLVKLPQLTPTETILDCTSELIQALEHLETTHPPSESLAPTTNFRKALKQLHDTLGIAPSYDISDQLPAFPRVPALDSMSEQVQRDQRVSEYDLDDDAYDDTIPTLRRSQRAHRPSQRLQDSQDSVQNIGASAILLTYDECPKHFSFAAINVDTGKLAEYRQLLKSSQGHLWEQGACEEFARLAQGLPSAGIPVSAGTNTIFSYPNTNYRKDVNQHILDSLSLINPTSPIQSEFV